METGQPAEEIKKSPEMLTIETDYHQTAHRLGELGYHGQLIQDEYDSLLNKLKELNKKAAELKKTEEGEKK